MGIQINGQTDTITAIDGQMTISGADLSTNTLDLSTINATGVSTFAGNIDANGDLDVDGHTELDAVNVSGFLTATSAYYSGDVTVLGTLTYEDVTNVDVVGIATARAGLRINGGGLYVTGVSTFNGDLSITDKIVHEGDTNTAIRFPSNETITAETAGSERLRITSGGYVGIGTDTPDAKLHLYSGPSNPTRVVIQGDGSSTAAASLILHSSDESANWRATGTFYYDAQSDVEWFSGRPYSASDAFSIHRKSSIVGSTGNSTANLANSLFLINSSGKVGIGTDNPGVAGIDILANSAAVRCRESGGADARLVSGGSISYFGTYSNHDLQILTNGSNALRITSSGNVGIGLTNPSEKLEIAVGAVPEARNLKFGVNSTLGTSEIYSTENGGYNRGLSLGGSDVIFSTNGGGNTTRIERLRITSTGNVGIGTDNPDGKLAVTGNGYNQINITSTNAANTNKLGGVTSQNYVGDKWSIIQTYSPSGSNQIYYGSADGSYRGATDHYFYVNSSPTATTGHTEALRITSSGQVAVNGGNPNANWGPFNVNIDGSNIMHLGYGANYDNYFTAGTSGTQIFRAAGTERFRIGSGGQIGINGANYGTSGQVLTSQGSGSAPQWATPSAAGVIQVKSTTKTDTTSYTSSSGSFSSDVMTVSITPTSSSNKILIIAHIHLSGPVTSRVGAKITVGGSEITAAIGNAAGSAKRSTITDTVGFSGNCIFPSSMTFLHSPGTTSTLTYGVQISIEGSQTVYLNQPQSGSTDSTIYYPISTITVMEVLP